MSSMDDLVKELQKELAAVKSQRDDLERDVENLCMQNGNSSIFSRSAVVSERIYQTDKELARVKALLASTTAERDSLQEDLLSTKESKRTTDTTWRVERDRVERLEKELSFYQSQSVRAMADRDKASWEAEELRSSTLAMEARLKVAESRAVSESTRRAESDRQLATAEERIRVLEEQAAECASIPGLRSSLVEAEALVGDLTATRSSLQGKLKAAEEQIVTSVAALQTAEARVGALETELAALQQSSSQEAADLQRAKDDLQAHVKELGQERDAAEARADEAEGALVAAQAEVELTRQSAARSADAQASAHQEREDRLAQDHAHEMGSLRRQLEELRTAHETLQQEFEQANKEKVQALMRLSAAEQTATQAFEEMGEMKDVVADLKQSLKKATEEKVAALMQLAGGRKGSGKVAKGSSASGWRVWGGGATDASGELEGGAAAEPSRQPDQVK